MGAAMSQIVRGWLRAIVDSLGSSDYLAGMLAMSMIGVGRDVAANSWRAMLTWLIRRLWVTIRLEEKEAELLRAWLREQPEVHASAELAVYSRRGVETGSRVYEFEPEIETTSRLRVRRKDGKSQWIWVTQGVKQTATVSFLGRNKSVLDFIFEQGKAIQKQKREKELTVVQVYDFGGDTGLHWLHPQERVAKQPGRPVSSVILPRCPDTGLHQAEALLRDAKEFLESEAWYSKRGIPYRRGYLLHGVPGGGKSSVVMALSHELQLPIYMLSLSSEKMSDDKLNQLLQFGMHDPPTILLLEDVDLLHSAVLHRTTAAKRSRSSSDSTSEDETSDKDGKGESEGKSKRSKKGQLTLSGLLNALDGPTATTGRLLFMTTNARERLDPALVRSGRIDYEVEFKSAVSEQMERLFCHFYSDFVQDLECPPVKQAAVIVGRSASASTSTVLPVEAELCASVPPPLSESGVKLTTDDIARLASSFAKQLSESGIKLTTADIQRHLVKHKTSPHRALEEYPSLLNIVDKDVSTVTADSPSKSVATQATEEAKDAMCMDVEASEEEVDRCTSGGPKQAKTVEECSESEAGSVPETSPAKSVAIQPDEEVSPSKSVGVQTAGDAKASKQSSADAAQEEKQACKTGDTGLPKDSKECSDSETGSVPEKTRADNLPEQAANGPSKDEKIRNKVPECHIFVEVS